MIPIEHSVDIARAAADAIFGAGTVKDITAVPVQDSEDQEALEISIKVAEGFSSIVTGDQIVGILSEIKYCLEASGENRRPLIRYVSENLSDK